MKKQCTKCGKIKGFDEFYKEKTGKNGLQSYCKKCKNAAASVWRKANPEKVKAKNKKETQNLPDYYVRNKLKQQSYPPEMISPELIEVKRTILKIKRACKKAS